MEKQNVKKFDPKLLADLPIVSEDGETFSDKTQKKLKELRVYEFSNIQDPGLAADFMYGTTKKNIKMKLFHGGLYELPIVIAKFLSNRKIPMYKYTPTGTGDVVKSLTGYSHRFMLREVI